MTTADDIVTEARSWVGTPFRHQGRVKGKCVDCAGHIARVGAVTKRTTFDTTQYSRQPNPRRMRAILNRELVPIAITEARGGDVFFMAYNSRHPRHLAIFTGESIIHAYEDIGFCVEHRFTDEWRRRVRAAYRYPEPL